MVVNISAPMQTPLSQCPQENELYAGLAEQLVTELRGMEETKAFGARSRLLSFGEVPSHLMILKEGKAEILLHCSKRAISLDTAAPGKVFGLKAIMTGDSAETDVVCVTPCVLTLIPAARFLALLRRHPEIYYMVAKILSADLQRADKVLKHTARGITRASRVKPGSELN